MALYDYLGNVIATGGSGGSPIEGEKICLIGDSNTQYASAKIKAYMEEIYGCTFTPLGYAGTTWENGENVSHDYSAIGRVDTLIANADASTNLCSDYDKILIMMGTNCTAVGTVDDTSETLTTMCGAVRYCLEKLLYYYRKGKIGVILPPQRNDGNDYMLERGALIKEICDEYSVPTLDLNRRGQIVGDSKLGVTSYYLGDGLHFGDNGVIQFNETVGKWIAYEL